MNELPVSRDGYFWVVFAALLWGVSGTAAKFLFNAGITSLELVQLRLTVGSVALALWFAVFDPRVFLIQRRDIPYFLIIGFGAMAITQFTYLLAISKIQVAVAILLQYMAPSVIALYTVLVARQRLSRPVLVAVALAAVGCYLVVGAFQVDILSMNRVGVLSGLLSAVSFAWYSLQGEYGMRKYGSWTVLFYAFVFAALAWNIFYPPLRAFARELSPTQWGCVFYIAVFGTALPFGFYLKGVRLIRSARASITATLEPITAGVVAFAFLGEIMSPLQIFGGLLVLSSIALLQWPRSCPSGSVSGKCAP